jgi:hypothetical protein
MWKRRIGVADPHPSGITSSLKGEVFDYAWKADSSTAKLHFK